MTNPKVTPSSWSWCWETARQRTHSIGQRSRGKTALERKSQEIFKGLSPTPIFLYMEGRNFPKIWKSDRIENQKTALLLTDQIGFPPPNSLDIGKGSIFRALSWVGRKKINSMLFHAGHIYQSQSWQEVTSLHIITTLKNFYSNTKHPVPIEVI